MGGGREWVGVGGSGLGGLGAGHEQWLGSSGDGAGGRAGTKAGWERRRELLDIHIEKEIPFSNPY